LDVAVSLFRRKRKKKKKKKEKKREQARTKIYGRRKERWRK